MKMERVIWQCINMKRVMLVVSYVLMISIVCFSFQANAQNKLRVYHGKSAAKAKQTKQIKLFPKFVIRHAADFPAFYSYLNENKEEYRARRSSELVAIAKGDDFSEVINTFEIRTDDDGDIRQTQNELARQVGGGIDKDLVKVMLEAYDKFDQAYERDKLNSRKDVGMDLGSQLQHALSSIMDEHLIDDNSAPIIFTYGSVATSLKAMQQTINGNQPPLFPDSASIIGAQEMAENSTHFIHGHWSYFENQYTGKRAIKVTVNLEQVGGIVKTFSAVGDAQGEAMNIIANKIIDYSLRIANNYEDIINPFAHLKLKKPLAVNDVKTYNEARLFCQSQSTSQQEYRLPYAHELLNMPGSLRRGGAHFLDLQNKSYAVADSRGGLDGIKLVPVARVNDDQSRLQQARTQEPLSYFCVGGDKADQVDRVEGLYDEMHDEFFELKASNEGKITKNACNAPENASIIVAIKEKVMQIINIDHTPKIPGVLRQCLVSYMKHNGNLGKEYSIIRKL